MIKQNSLFEYNLPLQAYRAEDGSVQILNYMPRKNSCCELSLNEFCDNEVQNEKDILYGTAVNLLNLAILFAKFAEKEIDAIYYHNEKIEEHFPPMSYKQILEKYGLIKNNQSNEQGDSPHRR